MSSELYRVGVWFYQNKGGQCKLNGQKKRLENPPSILGGFIEEVEHCNDVHVHRLRKKFEGWRDMEREEVKAMDAWLRMKLGPAKKSYE